MKLYAEESNHKKMVLQTQKRPKKCFYMKYLMILVK